MSPSAVPSGRTICQSALAPGTSCPADLGTGERSAGQGHDAPVTLGGVAEIERLAQRGLQAVDRGQARVGKPNALGRRVRRVVRVGLERRDGDAHPVGEREGAEQTVELRSRLSARYRPSALASPGATGGFQIRTQVPLVRQLRGGGRLGALRAPRPRSWALRPGR